ncbi:RHS repeat-associated core domain-containing protein [Ferruginibacter sp. HRS2-29]|uniref:RHS repeat-associated core domain-containing protein n=1 Tax=Ferruginibacter sp. HRS2-29 TaxID=2487334 RepID=UPI0020CEA338|nr:RHS repeat-associated core domain-containing protein [Ferruginibacter sp. HRS2-29]
MLMPGRKFSADSKYRYGFNGKENDNDVKGEGNQQDYGMRIYDPRIGKFLSVDPFTIKYPFYSPYQFSGNDVIRCVDLDGGEPISKVGEWDTQTAFLSGTIYNFVYDKITHTMFSLQGVVDPKTGRLWIVADDGQGQQQYFYLVNDDGATDKLRTHVVNGLTTLYKSHMQRFETRDEIDAKQGAAIARGFGGAAFSGTVLVACLPIIVPVISKITAWVAASGESAATILSAAFGDASAAYSAATTGAVIAGGTVAGVRAMAQEEAVVGEVSTVIRTESGASKLTTNGVSLNKKMASEAQMAEAGEVIAGGSSGTPLRKAGDLSKQFWGQEADWVKKRSSSHTAPDNITMETHWEENVISGQRTNMKTKMHRNVSQPEPKTKNQYGH